MKRFLILCFVSLALFAACTNERKEEIGTPSQPVSFKTEVQPILETYCYQFGNQRCHIDNSNQGAPFDFREYAQIKETIDSKRFQTKVLGASADMPPFYSAGPKVLAPADKAKLQAWVNQGAPNN